MNKKLYYAKSRGQSIPLLALMLVVLFGMAALALDVGNTYAEQREVVRAANAAALEAMDAVNDNFSDVKVKERIFQSLTSHRLPVTANPSDADPMKYEAYYFDASGKRLCQIGFCSHINRDQVSYVRVAIDGKVDTYFAQLLGRPTLPVNAVAHASSSICTDGIYPISIDKTTLDEDKGKWLNEDRLYSDDIYKGLSVRRVWQKESGNPGQFGYMRWPSDNNAGNTPWLSKALTPPAKVANYNEAAWPSSSELTKPEGYPIMPNEMNKGDWIHGNSGHSEAVSTELEYLISKRVILNLPLYDAATGNGANAVYHLYGVGKFMLLDYGHQGGSGGGWYMDLAYVGEGEQCVGLMTGTVESRTMTLEGQVSLYPHAKYIPDSANAPLQLLIVLDASGSMNFNFNGEAYKNGAGPKLLCQGSGSTECVNGSYVWNNDSERRASIAANVLKEMVLTKLRPQDQVRIVNYHNAYYQYGEPRPDVPFDEVLGTLTTSLLDTWTNDPNVIEAALDKAALVSSNSGETPSALGLARAREVYNNSNAEYAPGKPYKRSIILLTDGMANVTLSGKWYRCPGPTPGTYVGDDITCMSGVNDMDDGKLDTNTDYPIVALNKEAAKLHTMIKGDENGNGSLNVVALGPIDEVGESLSQVSSTNTVYSAKDEAQLREGLEAIFSAVTNMPCEDTFDRSSPTTVIESANLPLGVPKLPEAAGGVVGYVKLSSVAWTSPATPIMWDSSTKKLSYRIEGIPPGDYNMTYWMMYRGTDGVVRSYEVAMPFNQSNGQPVASQSISLKPSTDVIGSVVRNLILDMQAGIDVCAPTEGTP